MCGRAREEGPVDVRGWTRDLGVSCLAALTAMPLAGFLLWISGLSGLVGAVVFGVSVALISIAVESGFRDSSGDA